ncbi:MAG: TonB-dependent receptor [Alphaproteobacteria bacterium]|nr:TonB-dependent receptor [Alphaproteobacteria bacterium]
MTEYHERVAKKRAMLLRCSAATALAVAVTGTNISHAQDSQDSAFAIDEIIVTATRRAGSVQDVPINIAATSGVQIEEQGFKEISDVLAFVPGINVVDRGGRMGNRVIVRGLNADSLGQGGSTGNTGGTVASYVGEIPLAIDLKLNDMERVETLLGPQGTLYGAGTLGGAIRYIPNRPDFEGMSLEVRGDAYIMSESDGVSHETGMTINVPLSETFALRGSIDYDEDRGYIDYNHVVAEIGVSDPNAPLSESANFAPKKDANGYESLSGRIAARWQPTEAFDANLTYYFQNTDNEGRVTSGHLGERQTEKYVSPSRVLEPDEQKNQLLALEVTADLGFAELTSASGVGKFRSAGNRDQTDLLIGLEYSYESFPNFTSRTQERFKRTFFNQEVRLVSTTESDLSWIVGGYYNRQRAYSTSEEYVPGLPEYWDIPRPDALEYFSAGNSLLEEKAVFGEVAYQITDAWQITVGARYYDYDLQVSDIQAKFPIFSDLDFVIPPFESWKDTPFEEDFRQQDNGSLFKINSSYHLTDDFMVYGTVSQGYRIGGHNGISQCDEYDPNAGQGACALAPGQQYGENQFADADFDERFYGPDKTTNYELGFKSTLADGAATFNAALFLVKWKGPQLQSSTINASLPITINADGAESKGIEMSGSWRVTDRFSLRGAFSYTDSELTAFTKDLLRTITQGAGGTSYFTDAFENGEVGDRLPGSPKTQFSIFANYDQPLSSGHTIRYNASLTAQGNVLSRTGGRAGGHTLKGYSVANASVVYDADAWSVTAYVDNLFNKYAETGVQSSSRANTTQQGHSHRAFQVNTLTPRQLGLRFVYRFGQ